MGSRLPNRSSRCGESIKVPGLPRERWLPADCHHIPSPLQPPTPRTRTVINQFNHPNFKIPNYLVFLTTKNRTTPFVLEFYLATSDNPFYTGQESMDKIARQIVSASGPSGTNREYLYQLATAVRQLVMDDNLPDASIPQHGDPHLFELENLVRALEQAGDNQQGPQ